ncbi:hypothetical protein [Streptomyces flavofungini]|uniref:hypothetical protein n=1 Tax=Streptomyces flavofungini TaxID=68200 RepID=UPI0034DEC607
MLRRFAALMLGTLALAVVSTVPAHAMANPWPVLPAVAPLVTEGVTIEGPLINNVALPRL